MSDDAIQDLLDEMDGIAAGDKVSHWTITRARGQHEAHRARVAELTSALEGRAAEIKQLHDCGQDGVCALSPGCVQCSIERSRELLAEVAQLQGWVATHKVDLTRIAMFRERAERSEAEVAELQKALAELTAAKDKEFARAEEWRSTVADLSRQYALGEDEATIAKLQAKVARLESAIADQVIADGVARGG